MAQGSDSNQRLARDLYAGVEDFLKEYYMKYPSAKAHAKELIRFAQKGESSLPNVQIVSLLGMVEQKIAKKHEMPFDYNQAVTAANGDTKFVNTVVPHGDKLVFETLEMKKPAISPAQKVVIESDGKVVESDDMALTQPVSEIVYNKFGRDNTSFIAKRKKQMRGCLDAIRTNYPKYAKQMQKASEQKDKKKKFKHQVEANAFMALAKGSCDGPYVDVRGWETLPNTISQAGFTLKDGKYTARYIVDGKELATKEFSVSNGLPAVVDFVLPTK